MLANPTPETAKAYINSLAALREAGKGYTAAEKTAQTAALEAARQVEIAKQAAVDALMEEAKDQAWQEVGGSQGNSAPQPGFFSAVGRKSFDLVNQFMLGIPGSGGTDGKGTTPADGSTRPLTEQNQSAIDSTLPDSPLEANFSQTNLPQQMTDNLLADGTVNPVPGSEALEADFSQPGQEAERVPPAAQVQRSTKPKGAGGPMTEMEIRRYLTGKPKVYEMGVARHIQGTPQYQAYRAEQESNGKKPPSCFTVKEQAIKAMVTDKMKKGDLTVKKAPHGDTRAIIVFAKPIGIVYNIRTGKMVPTRVVAISISRDKGYHFYPVEEDKWYD